jgi:leader peptidase (prepilin peptidase)/N-methyltransferase
LGVWDNLPLASFLLLRGACRYCQTPISYQYPLIEGISGLVTVLLGWKFGLSGEFLQALLLFAALLIVSVIDLHHQIIPDVITYPGILIGLIISGLSGAPGWVSSLIGVLIGGGVLWGLALVYILLARREGMGGGDIKLLAMIGAFQGWPGVLVTLLAGSFVGTVAGLILILLWKKDRTFAIPFGPFLSFGAVIYLFFGPLLLQWYLG